MKPLSTIDPPTKPSTGLGFYAGLSSSTDPGPSASLSPSADPGPAADPSLDRESAWTATGHERPVFFDESGRRSRWVMAGGVCAGGASAFWFTALVAGAIGFSTLPTMRPLSPSVGLRSEAHERVALEGQAAAFRHRRAVVVSARRPSSLTRTTGLAVSRGLIAGE